MPDIIASLSECDLKSKQLSCDEFQRFQFAIEAFLLFDHKAHRFESLIASQETLAPI